MGKNDERYSKLELEKNDNSFKKKTLKFNRKLEIFGVPPRKEENNLKQEKTSVDTSAQTTTQKTQKTPESISKNTVRSKTPKMRPVPHRRQGSNTNSKELEQLAEQALKGDSTQTVYEEMLERNRNMPEHRKRQIRQKARDVIRREKAQQRLEQAQTTIVWTLLIVSGIGYMIYISDDAATEFIIRIGVIILFVFLSARGGYNRWRR